MSEFALGIHRQLSHLQWTHLQQITSYLIKGKMFSVIRFMITSFRKQLCEVRAIPVHCQNNCFFSFFSKLSKILLVDVKSDSFYSGKFQGIVNL